MCLPQFNPDDFWYIIATIMFLLLSGAVGLLYWLWFLVNKTLNRVEHNLEKVKESIEEQETNNVKISVQIVDELMNRLQPLHSLIDKIDREILKISLNFDNFRNNNTLFKNSNRRFDENDNKSNDIFRIGQ